MLIASGRDNITLGTVLFNNYYVGNEHRQKIEMAITNLYWFV